MDGSDRARTKEPEAGDLAAITKPVRCSERDVEGRAGGEKIMRAEGGGEEEGIEVKGGGEERERRSAGGRERMRIGRRATLFERPRLLLGLERACHKAA